MFGKEVECLNALTELHQLEKVINGLILGGFDVKIEVYAPYNQICLLLLFPLDIPIIVRHHQVERIRP